MRKNIIVVLATLAVAFVASVASAAPARINFEGFGPANAPGTEGDPVASVMKQGVQVSFLTEDSAGNQFVPVLAQVGSPRLGFQSTLGDDTPLNDDGTFYAAGGQFSLTDEIRQTRDYIINFSTPIANLSLDLYDFRADGPHAGGNPGSDTVTLELYNSAGSVIGTDSYTIPNPRPVEGNVVNLGSSINQVASARIVFSSLEGGTAIDNIMFTVPEPSSMGLASFGLVGLLGMRRRRRAAA